MRLRMIRRLAFMAVATLGAIGCNGGPGGTHVQAPGVDVQAGPGGARVRAPGVAVDSGPGGADVRAPGVDVQAR